MRKRGFSFLLISVMLLVGVQSFAETAHKFTGIASDEADGRFRVTVGTKGMVAADDLQAAEWGAEILRRGGNAADAAAAVGFAMSVTRPHYASLGGGGFAIVCASKQSGGNCEAIDFREKAPEKASRDMYVKDGKADSKLSQEGPLAIGVPGLTAGLLAISEKFGKLKNRKLILSKPIELATRGIRFSSHSESAGAHRFDVFNTEGKKIFGCSNAICPVGTVIKQPDLARVLKAISDGGAKGFYSGTVGKKIADGIQKAGGILSLKDLDAYEPKWRTPVRGQFHGAEIISMPPPSAGGTVMLELFQFIEIAEKMGQISETKLNTADTYHVLAHAMSLGFADRAFYFGDPDFVNVPVTKLLERERLEKRWKESFQVSKANILEKSPKDLGENLAFSDNDSNGRSQTTHFSVVDENGNAVSLTTTVNDEYGSGFVPPGTGIVMNNEMDDFSALAGSPNLFGLVGAEANAIAPFKRPLSSMTPTIVRENGEVRFAIGAQGGPRITTSVFQSLLNRLYFGLSLQDSVSNCRIHQQWKPRTLMFESACFSGDSKVKLEALGYEMKAVDTAGKVHGIERFSNGRTWGFSDPRTEGGAVAQ